MQGTREGRERQRRHQHHLRRGISRAVAAATVSASIAAVTAALLPAVSSAATRTQNFDIAPANWVGVNNTGVSGNAYGFSPGNLTGQASPGGEAGGTFARSSSNDRGMYGDNTIGTLTQNDIIHADGEFWFGNGASADTDGGFGHQDTNWLSSGFNVNFLGIGTYEGSPATDGFRFAALIYTDNNAERVGTRIHVPNGQYKFTYDWNPNTDTLTASILSTAGATIATSTVTTAPTDTFSFNAFGIGSAFNGSTDTSKHYDYFIDGVTYSIEGPVTPEWNLDDHGDWFTTGNWLGPVPNAPGAIANFHGKITADRLIYCNSNATVGTLSFDNSHKYLITGLGTLTLQASSGSASISVAQGSHEINLPMTIASNTNVTVAGGATLTIADPVTINSGVNLSQSGNVIYQSTVHVLSGASASFAGATSIGTLSLGSGAHAELAAGSGSVLHADQISVSGGQVDIQDNKLVTAMAAGSAKNGVYSGVQGLVQSGAITTSQAAAQAGLTTVAVAVTDQGTVAAYTYAGDANLDGTIDGGDYGIIDNFAQIPGADSYANGDFNYDGVIDGGDYGIIDNNIQAQGAPLLTSGAMAGGVTAVPEPSACGLALLAAAALFGHRRRRRVDA